MAIFTRCAMQIGGGITKPHVEEISIGTIWDTQTHTFNVDFEPSCLFIFPKDNVALKSCGVCLAKKNNSKYSAYWNASGSGSFGNDAVTVTFGANSVSFKSATDRASYTTTEYLIIC